MIERHTPGMRCDGFVAEPSLAINPRNSTHPMMTLPSPQQGLWFLQTTLSNMATDWLLDEQKKKNRTENPSSYNSPAVLQQQP